jgi:hypothetical protein
MNVLSYQKVERHVLELSFAIRIFINYVFNPYLLEE